MPASADLAEGLARATVDLYAYAERLLLTMLRDQLGRDIDSPTWAEVKLAEVGTLRARVQAVLDRLTSTGGDSIAEAILAAWDRGGAAAVADLAAAPGEPLTPPSPRPVDLLAEETSRRVQATHRGILRTVADGYRDVVARAAGRVLLGTTTRREAAQRALDDLAANGITGFVDRAGRGWDLTSYVEMAVRTSTAHAAVAGHTATLTAAGQDLVVVSDAPQECKLCRPWEGKVLSLTGRSSKTTLNQARAAGLFHPGCRHSVSVYLPGITKAPSRTADPEGDRARQRLRYLERQVRAWKRRQAVAITPQAERTAAVRIRDYQALIRQHVASTSAKRQPARERIGAAR